MNQVTLIGRLGTNPETKVVGEHTVTNASLATDESYKNKDGEKVEKTEWHNLDIWNKPGEVFAKYAGKGSKIAIIGKLQTKSWTTESGEERKRTVIQVMNFEFLDTKKDAEEKKETTESNESDLPF